MQSIVWHYCVSRWGRPLCYTTFCPPAPGGGRVCLARLQISSSSINVIYIDLHLGAIWCMFFVLKQLNPYILIYWGYYLIFHMPFRIVYCHRAFSFDTKSLLLMLSQPFEPLSRSFRRGFQRLKLSFVDGIYRNTPHLFILFNMWVFAIYMMPYLYEIHLFIVHSVDTSSRILSLFVSHIMHF